MQAKRGILLDAANWQLHDTMVEALTSDPAVPLDILEKAVVTKEEHICIPAYVFKCSAIGTYTYEVGHERERVSSVKLENDQVRVENEKYTEWTPKSGTVSAEAEFVVPGNKVSAPIITYFYKEGTWGHMYSCSFPPDTQTLAFDISDWDARYDYVKPYVDHLLREKAANSLKGIPQYRYLSMGTSDIDYDCESILVGFYHIVYEYNGNEYSMLVTNDGRSYYPGSVPLDDQREQIRKEKQGVIDRVKHLKKCFKILAVPAVIGLILLRILLTVKFNCEPAVCFIAVWGYVRCCRPLVGA
jgi:hypothetical protein